MTHYQWVDDSLPCSPSAAGRRIGHEACAIADPIPQDGANRLFAARVKKLLIPIRDAGLEIRMRSIPFQQREIQLMLFAIVLREDDAILNDGRGCGIPDQIVIERNFRPFQRVFIPINGTEKPLQAVVFAGKKAVYLLILDSGEALQFQTVACVALDEAQIALLIHRLERHKIILNRCADQEITYLREGGKSVWDIDHCRFAGLFAENLRPGVRIEFLHGIQREIVDALAHIVRDTDGLLLAHRSVPG